MPSRETVKRARKDARQGKSPSTQAGEFVHEEIRHVREGKHGARSTKQAIAIGLSKARRAGVKLPATKTASARTRAKAKQDLAKGRRPRRKTSRTRARAVKTALSARLGGPRRLGRCRAKRTRVPADARRRNDQQRRAKPRTRKARARGPPPRARPLGLARETAEPRRS